MNIKQSLTRISVFLNIEPISKIKDNQQEVERISQEFDRKLPNELEEYIQIFAPSNDFYFDTVGNPMRLYGIPNLKKLQEGYNYNSRQQKPINGWADNLFMLADQGADPVVIDLDSNQMEIQRLIHGAGNWDSGEVIADNIGQFLLCSAALHHAVNGFEEDVIIDDEHGFCLAPRAAEWYFTNMKKWAGDYYQEWCTDFDNH